MAKKGSAAPASLAGPTRSRRDRPASNPAAENLNKKKGLQVSSSANRGTAIAEHDDDEEDISEEEEEIPTTKQAVAHKRTRDEMETAANVKTAAAGRQSPSLIKQVKGKQLNKRIKGQREEEEAEEEEEDVEDEEAEDDEEDDDEDDDEEDDDEDDDEEDDIANDDPEEGDEENAMDMKDIVQVDFEFFDPQPIDFAAYRNMFNRLFCDLESVNSSELADLVLAQPLVGTTIKVDGTESDPYALLTVLNLQVHSNKEAIKQVKELLLEKASKKLDGAKLETFRRLITSAEDDEDDEQEEDEGAIRRAAAGSKQKGKAVAGSKKQSKKKSEQVGWIISERFINMPPQVVPPMYRLLQEEIGYALEENEPYEFGYYLWIAKTYKYIDQGKKKGATATKGAQQTLNFFNPEEEFLSKYADIWFDFKIATPTSGPKQTLENQIIEPFRRAILIPADRMAIFSRVIEKEYPPPASS